MTPADDRDREPREDAPAEDAPSREAPAEDAPSREAPAEDAPREGSPAGEAPRDDGPRTDGPRADDDAPTLTLQDALKLAGFVGTGGQAKRIVQAGEVLVNGEVETRRKRRLRPGDEITVDDETFVLELEDGDEEQA